MVLVILVMVGMTAVPAASASPTPESVPDLAIAGPRGRFHGENIVTPEPDARQIASGTVRPGRSSWFSVSLRNVGSGDDSFDLRGSGDGDGFMVRYYDHRSVEVTAEVVAGTYGVSLDVGRRTSMSIEVVAPDDADVGDGRTVWLRAVEPDLGNEDLVRGHATVPPLKVWAVSFDGQLRCTATFPHRSLEPGRFTDVRVRLTNVTHDTITIAPQFGALVFRNQDGDKVGDSVPPPFPRPGPIPVTLKPGHSVGLDIYDARVRWSGPLSVTVLCSGGRFAMPPVRLPVTVPEAPASIAAAIDAAVGVSGSPWQVCHPGPAGQPATGVLPTPLPSHLPDMTVRCWATVTQEDGFDVVNLNMVSHDDAPAYTLGEDNPFSIEPDPGQDGPNYLAVRWDFVVTADAARPYSSGMQSQALGTGKATSFALFRGGWHVGGGGPCGYWSVGWSPGGSSLLLDWIAGCTQDGVIAAPVARGAGAVEREHGHVLMTRRAG
jgi:hypothetical protein